MSGLRLKKKSVSRRKNISQMDSSILLDILIEKGKKYLQDLNLEKDISADINLPKISGTTARLQRYNAEGGT